MAFVLLFFPINCYKLWKSVTCHFKYNVSEWSFFWIQQLGWFLIRKNKTELAMLNVRQINEQLLVSFYTKVNYSQFLLFCHINYKHSVFLLNRPIWPSFLSNPVKTQAFYKTTYKIRLRWCDVGVEEGITGNPAPDKRQLY